MFSEWLSAPSNVVSWLIQLFVTWGPIPFILVIFVIVVVARPHVPRAMPIHHRRAITQQQWAFHIALAFTLISLMLAPAVLTWLNTVGLISDVAANAMSTMVVMVAGISYLLPHLFSVHIWFPRPTHWFPRRSWIVSPRIRLRVWVVVMMIWVCTEFALVVGGLFFKPATSSVSANEIVKTVFYYTVEGFFFLGMSIYIQTKISRRPPVPGVPLAIDMQLRRVDLGHVQQISTVFLGAGVSRCLQFLAQLQYESAPFVLAALSFVLSWAVSLVTLVLALIPTWVLVGKRDPSQRLMKNIEARVLDVKRELDLFSLKNFQDLLGMDDDEIIAGSAPRPTKNFLAAIFSQTPPREELTAPGTGSSPDEVLAAYMYMARIADRAGMSLSVEEVEGLREIREAIRDLAERRARLNEGVASNLARVETQHEAGSSNWWGRFGLGRGGEENEPDEAEGAEAGVDENLRNLLGQTEATSVVGLDQQTIAAWEEYDEKKEQIELQEKQMSEMAAMQQSAMEAYGYYGYPGYPDEYGYGYPGYPDEYGGYGYETYNCYDSYGYADLGYGDMGDGYGNPGYGGAYGDPAYGYGAYGSMGYGEAGYPNSYDSYGGEYGYDPQYYMYGGYGYPGYGMSSGEYADYGAATGSPGSGGFGEPAGYIEAASCPAQLPGGSDFMRGQPETPPPGDTPGQPGFEGGDPYSFEGGSGYSSGGYGSYPDYAAPQSGYSPGYPGDSPGGGSPESGYSGDFSRPESGGFSQYPGQAPHEPGFPNPNAPSSSRNPGWKG
ncbi:hypothetical protein HHJ78_08055 [Mobiluncus mulieris]|uniref:Uncharacterized protein n=1 Tax=Mobiluncus mulieris TaxID=2052 RepID=A0A7Y0Y4K2_9ACTO|nr:hypothetical protein [Mobiluncus mulieris]